MNRYTIALFFHLLGSLIAILAVVPLIVFKPYPAGYPRWPRSGGRLGGRFSLPSGNDRSVAVLPTAAGWQVPWHLAEVGREVEFARAVR